MTRSRDDMVIRPLLDERQAAAMTRAREDRRFAGGRRKGGILNVAMRALRARKLKRLRRRFESEAKVVGAARRGAHASQYLAPKGKVPLSPLGLILTAGVVGVAVAARQISGRSFENLGNQLNRMLLGDMDDKARAAISVRNHFSSDRHLAWIAGKEGEVTSQMRSIQKDLLDFAERYEKGKSLFLEAKEYEVPTTIDMLINRIRKLFRDEFVGSDLAADVRTVVPAYLGISERQKLRNGSR